MFQDFAKHCGFNIKVCKPYRAKTKGKVERFNHYLRYSFHNALRVKLSMMNYRLNIDNANAEVIKWLDEVANRRIHKTTLQVPFELLVHEQPHLLSVPKPYKGIHPKVVIASLAKNRDSFNRKTDIDSIYIPQRDMQYYDDLIPSVAIAMSTTPLLVCGGGVIWS